MLKTKRLCEIHLAIVLIVTFSLFCLIFFCSVSSAVRNENDNNKHLTLYNSDYKNVTKTDFELNETGKNHKSLPDSNKLASLLQNSRAFDKNQTTKTLSIVSLNRPRSNRSPAKGQRYNKFKDRQNEAADENPKEEDEQENQSGDKKVKIYKIGAFYNAEGSAEETALKLAIEKFNKANEDPSASESGIGIKFVAQVEILPQNSFLASPLVCGVLAEGIVAIFGPQNPETASHIQSICDAFEIPHIETKWDYEIRRENYLVNLAPYPFTLSRAVDDLVEKLEWTEYSILYENDEGLFALQDLIRNSVQPDRKAHLIKLPSGDDIKDFLRNLLMPDSDTNPNSDDPKHAKKIVVDCGAKRIHNILKQTQQIGLLNNRVSFIFTSLDIQTVDLEEFKDSRASIFAYRMIDPSRPEVEEALKHWRQFHSVSSDQPQFQKSRSSLKIPTFSNSTNNKNQFNKKKRLDKNRIKREDDEEESENGSKPDDDAEKEEEKSIVAEESPKTWPADFTMDVALIYDALELLAASLELVNEIQEISTGRLHCESGNTWQQGYSVINYMKMMKIQGLTGWIQFNTTGFRSDVSLDVVQLKETGLEKIGSWDWKFVNKLNWLSSPKPAPKPLPELEKDGRPSLRGKTLVVTTIITAPLTMWRESEFSLDGNERYEGYAVDLVEKLSETLGFNYVIKPVGDGNYGSPNKKGEWNGMIREVMDGVADIAVADLTVNKMRQSAVDLTMPFMSLGISIMYVAPSVKPPSLLSFMQPMGVEVWLLVALALTGTSITLHLCARLTPYEWIEPHGVNDPDELENEFTLRDCFFFTLGTYLCQGAAIAPKTASTRMIAGFWWLFTLIMVSSYTANLATFLIVQDLDMPIKSIEDLPNQDKIKYGCLGGGTTATFFRTSPFELYQLIWEKMVVMAKTDKDIFQPSNKKGVDRVYKDAGGYAFFMESTGIEYNIERNCKLAQVGGLLDNKGYAIALKKGSNYTQSFSSGILKMQEKGILDELRRKWWKEERSDNVCADEPDGEGGGVQPLRLANVGGVFIILIIGCIIACVFSVFELLFSAKELAEEHNESFWSELGKEIRFAFSCQGTTKPVRKPKESSEKSEKSEKSSVKDQNSVKSKASSVENLNKGKSMGTNTTDEDHENSENGFACPRYDENLTSPTTIIRRQWTKDKEKENFISGSLTIKYMNTKDA